MSDGANPEAKTTIVNVKGIEVEVWKMVHSMSSRHGESLGSVLNRAVRQLYQIDRGPRELHPEISGHLIPRADERLSSDQLTARIMAVAALQQSTAALKQATGRAHGLRVMSRFIADLGAGLPAPALNGKALANLRPKPANPDTN